LGVFFLEVFFYYFSKEKQLHASILSIVGPNVLFLSFELQTYIVHNPFPWGFFCEVWDHHEYMPKLILMEKKFGLKN
jgi:hypothetical protein